MTTLERLQPDSRYMALFREIVLDVWRERERETMLLRTDIERRVEALRDREDLLESALLYEHKIDGVTYERQRDKLRADLAVAEMELEDARVTELDLEAVLGFAEHLMTNAARFWLEASPEQKIGLQTAFFPEGIPFDGHQIGTAVTCLAFRDFGESETVEEGMASPRGTATGWKRIFQGFSKAA